MIDFTKFDHLRKAAKENQDVAYLLALIGASLYVDHGEIGTHLGQDRRDELETILMAADSMAHDALMFHQSNEVEAFNG